MSHVSGSPGSIKANTNKKSVGSKRVSLSGFVTTYFTIFFSVYFIVNKF
jgi:hypothetical protein